MRGELAGDALHDACRQLLARIHQLTDLRIDSVRDLPLPHQGASGAEVRLVRVRWRGGGGAQGEEDLAIKHASLKERRILQLLNDQGQAVPPALSPASTRRSADRAPLLMPFARSRPMDRILGDPCVPMTQQVARGLARLHAANRGQCPAWLPRAADDTMSRLYLQATQDEWARCMDAAAFRREYGQYDRPLRESLARLLDFVAALDEEGSCFTLLNSDLHPDHIRLFGGQPVFIDWEQACFGPLYLDLVNYFTLETAMLYRDALAEAGFAIPTAAFMQRYREAGLFMGLRYLEVGLVNWQAGGEVWLRGRWFFHYCLAMALGGR
ncbi:MAG: aminoglycoside phosphotransferase family protein [Anaerolineaceae bacterium]|nr:aminoglycoside phosphotransferase family protein [Anaerolineaceae bacterium]